MTPGRIFEDEMFYEEPVFRPPSEAQSLLLTVTVGCSRNRCAFCGMYRTKKYRVRDLDEIRADVEEARRLWRPFQRVFLLDGDALSADEDFLAEVLALIRARLPWVERVGVYGDHRAILGKGEAGMRRLCSLGLGIVYHGLESGNLEVLARMKKPMTHEEVVETGRVMKASGVRYSVMALLGLGGIEMSEEHARDTARALSWLDPDYVGLLTLMLVPGTALYRRWEKGGFRLPDRFGMLREMREILGGLHVTQARFSANHASNYLPIRGDLPRDRERLLALVDHVLASRDDTMLKPEWMRGL